MCILFFFCKKDKWNKRCAHRRNILQDKTKWKRRQHNSTRTICALPFSHLHKAQCVCVCVWWVMFACKSICSQYALYINFNTQWVLGTGRRETAERKSRSKYSKWRGSLSFFSIWYSQLPCLAYLFVFVDVPIARNSTHRRHTYCDGFIHLLLHYLFVVVFKLKNYFGVFA